MCIRFVSFSFILNREVCGHVSPSRGLKQGDPLSPFIFLFCMEGLSCLLSKAEANGKIHGLKFGTGCLRVSHLLFADDSFMFMEAYRSECEVLKRVLDYYSVASGQLVNYDKS